MKKLQLSLIGMLLAGVLAMPGWVLAAEELQAYELAPIKPMRVQQYGAEVATGYRVLPIMKSECGYYGGKALLRFADRLELDENQQAQLKLYREAILESCNADRKQAKALRKRLRRAISSGADRNLLDDIGAELGHLEVTRAETKYLLRQEFQAVLTGEQKVLLKQLRAKSRARFKKTHFMPRERQALGATLRTDSLP
ncbi:MAG: hypothetical protein K0U59_07220 [Gammaproteobacteria bacterium]|nr:hypothetical protein [Gammaproteobacteria bacterium]